MELEYNNLLINKFENLYYDNKFIILRNKGTILELVNCIKNNCLMYKDVPFDYKDKYNLSFIDDGIDCININDNIFYQVKFYSKHQRLFNNDLDSFFVYVYNLQKYNFKYYIIYSQDIILSKNKMNDVIYEEINDNIINNYIHNAYNLLFDKLDKKLLNELHNEIDIVFNNMINNKYYNISKLKEIKNKLIDKIPKENKEIKIKELYKHQEDLLNIMNNTKEKDNYFNLPCASGKSYIIELFSINNKDKKILILVPNILLAEQYKDNFNKNKINININECWTNTNKKFNEEYNIYVCVYDSYEYLKNINFDYIIVDEAHHILKWMKEDKKYKNALEKEKEDYIDKNGDNIKQIINNKLIYDDINNKESIKFYFSATLLFINKEITYYYSMDKAIEDNIINDFNINIYQIKELNDINIIKTLLVHQEYKRILIYYSRIETIKRLTELFNKYNIQSKYLYSDMNIKERNIILKDLYNGKIRVIFSINTLCEGIDIPNVDTCYFYDDKNSIISIIQCLGRIMRKSNDKIKSNLIFFTSDINDCNYDKYLNKINNYCNKFMNIKFNNENIFKYINYYNEKLNFEEEIIINNENDEEEDKYMDEEMINEDDIKTIIMENVINNLKVNDEMKIKLCEEFYNENKRIPHLQEIYKEWKIGRFYYHLQDNINNNIKNKIEKIFNKEIKKNKKIIKKNDDEKIKLCQEYYNDFNKLPKKDTIYKNWNIGNFIDGLKHNKNKHLKNKIEKIFNCDIKINNNIILISDEEKIKLCQDFYKEHKRLPISKEIYKDFHIGNFINCLKNGQNKHLKNKIEKIFNCDIKINNNIILISDEEKIKLCQEFYDEYHRLPTNREIYKEFNIGSFIKNLKSGKNKHLKEQINNIFNIIIEKKERITDEEKIKLCQEFYDEYHRLPLYNEIYKEFNISSFINGLKNNHNNNIKKQIEDIFNINIKKSKTLNLLSDEEKIKLCQEFYNEFHRLPIRNEEYKEFKIYSFISSLKNEHNQNIKNKIEDIFKCNIIKNRNNIKISNDEKIKLCQEFYNEFHRLPTTREIYKNWKIGSFVDGFKYNRNLSLKEDIEKIFETQFKISKK